mgnify:CR=1 FL=1
MTELKQGRWVKVHNPGQANFEERENVMDIVIGNNRYQAEATYTARTYKKAAYWLIKYLESAGAVISQAAEQIAQQIETVGKDDELFTVSGENWSCTIEKMAQECFKAKLNWSFEEPVTPKKPASRRRKKKTAE